MIRWIFCILFFVGSSLGMVALQEAGEKPKETPAKQKEISLTELAQKNRQQSEANKKTLLITNADLGSLRNSKVGTSRGTSAPAVKEGTETEMPESEPAESKEEALGLPDSELAEWAPMFQQATMDFKTAVNSRMVLELRINNLQNAYYRETDGARRTFWETELAKAAEELELARESEQTARNALRDLETEAKNAGLLPGQIRKMVGELPEAKSIVDTPNP
jgi:hypothetical protein